MKLSLEVDSLKELRDFCKEYLELYVKTVKTVDGYARIRTSKHFEEFEIKQVIDWSRQRKRSGWIALQLSRNTQSIYNLQHKLRKEGHLSKAGARSGRVAIPEDERYELKNKVSY